MKHTLLIRVLIGTVLAVLYCSGSGLSAAGKLGNDWQSPIALAVSPDGQRLYVAAATGEALLILDTGTGKILRSIDLPDPPTGVCPSPNGQRLFVTTAAPESKICILDATTGKLLKTLAAGHSATAPAISADEKTLFVCNRFNNDVSIIDLGSGKETARVKVIREPVACALTKDGKHLLVANLLHNGRGDADYVAAKVSVIEVASRRVVKELSLPNGSGSLMDIRISPDGRYAFVSHILARFHLPTTQLERGWMNTNAGTLIDLLNLKIINTVLLDNVDSGAANPWGVAWSADGKFVCVAHAGTHEVSIINFPALLEKLGKLPEKPDPNKAYDYTAASRSAADVPNDLSFLVGVRQRIKLGQNGPRAVVISGNRAFIGNYFSDTISVVDLAEATPRPQHWRLSLDREPSMVRKGEQTFHDAGICFQGWQSCASCHPGNARVDALNWDLLNDGIGNPKNNKSLLLTHKTPPAMSMGVRESGEMAVRAGIRHILFTVQPDAAALSMDEYLKSLKPVPSPYLVKGSLSKAAQRGRKVYQLNGCAGCHPGPLYTSQQHYDVGTLGQFDRGNEQFDTPTLVECWRTAPYLHDGSAATMKDTLTAKNPKDKHGITSKLTPQQMDDLVEYVLSL
jgi:YVTN family beta-propeller protein